MRLVEKLAATLTIGCLPMMVSAHHSNAEWDESVKQEFEGEIVNVVWRNPHVHWSMMVRNDRGEEELWNLAGSSLNHLDRQGVPKDPFRAGDIVRVWGSASIRIFSMRRSAVSTLWKWPRIASVAIGSFDGSSRALAR